MQHITEYDVPVRATSPASSLGTAYPADQSTFSDTDDLSQSAFEQRCHEHLGLDLPRPEELQADLDPLLPRVNDAAEEQELYEKVIHSLQKRVRELEENELFEQTLLRGSRIALERQPTSDNIDTLMHGLMANSADFEQSDARGKVLDGPWLSGTNTNNPSENEESTQTSSATDARDKKGKGRSRKLI